MPFSTRTRSPLRKEGAHSWVMTRVLPSSMRKVTRYTLLEPAAVLPLVPELPTEPLLLVPLLPVVLLRGTTSIRVTTLLGVPPEVDAVELLELVSWPLLAMPLVLPVMPLLLELSMLPALALPMLPAAVLPLVPLVPVLLLPVSDAMLLALAGVLCAASPLVEALEVLLAVSLLVLPLFMPVELHAASPSASTPANSTLCSLRFMINSF